jgi:tetratricopeptide (TPR) repeat protein
MTPQILEALISACEVWQEGDNPLRLNPSMHTYYPGDRRPVSKEPADYAPTYFDRHGPDAGGHLKALAYGLMVFGITITAGSLLLVQSKVTLTAILILLATAFVCGGAVTALSMAISNAAGDAYKHLMVNGSSTPYKEQYSYQQALVMAGQLDDALESFEAVMAEQPEAIDPRMKAAELYARDKKNYVRAAEIFREVRSIPTVTAGEDIYATNRLVDLLNGPLNEPGRALVELRRLIEKYPASAGADHARDALAALKPRHVPPID